MKWMCAYFGPAIFFSVLYELVRRAPRARPSARHCRQGRADRHGFAEQRLPDAGTPAEIQPLVVSFNQALERASTRALRG